MESCQSSTKENNGGYESEGLTGGPRQASPREWSWAATIWEGRQARCPGCSSSDGLWITHANTLSDSERSRSESLQTNVCCVLHLRSPASLAGTRRQRQRSLPSCLEGSPSRECLLAPTHFYYSFLYTHLHACVAAKLHTPFWEYRCGGRWV